MPYDAALASVYVRMFEHGHSFDDIRRMNLEDFGTVLSVWHEKSRIESKKARLRDNARNKGKRKSIRG
jgi:hypothetical protein